MGGLGVPGTIYVLQCQNSMPSMPSALQPNSLVPVVSLRGTLPQAGTPLAAEVS